MALRQWKLTRSGGGPAIVFRYLAPLICTALAVLITAELQPLTQQKFVVFVAAVGFSAWYGGLGPGLLATALATLSINFLFLEPPFKIEFHSADFARLGMFVAVALIITGLNESRERVERRLRQSEEHFRLLVEGVSDYAIFMLDPSGRVMTWNKAATQITGYTAEQIIGEPYSILFSSEDVQRAKPDVMLASATATGRAEDEGWRMRRDGSLYWAGAILTALRDEHGTLQGFSKVTRDLSERRSAQERDRRRQAELAHMSRLTTMNELASGIAHELNQPLSAITIYSQGCLDKITTLPNAPAEVVDALRLLSTQAERAAGIVEHYRRLGRKRTPSRKPTQINAIIRGAAALLQADISRGGVSMKFELDQALPLVTCDEVEIEQAIVNVVKNAVEALETIEGPRELQIRSSVDAGKVAVAVKDNGPGLVVGSADAAFEPFKTTKPNGLGMGLPISRSIIESHGGSMHAAANPGGGTVVTITLPVAESTNAAMEPAHE